MYTDSFGIARKIGDVDKWRHIAKKTKKSIK